MDNTSVITAISVNTIKNLTKQCVRILFQFVLECVQNMSEFIPSENIKSYSNVYTTC